MVIFTSIFIPMMAKIIDTSAPPFESKKHPKKRRRRRPKLFEMERIYDSGIKKIRILILRFKRGRGGTNAFWPPPVYHSTLGTMILRPLPPSFVMAPVFFCYGPFDFFNFPNNYGRFFGTVIFFGRT